MAIIEFMKWKWPDDAVELLSASILDVQPSSPESVSSASLEQTMFMTSRDLQQRS